jgi:hypothetical protein
MNSLRSPLTPNGVSIKYYTMLRRITIKFKAFNGTIYIQHLKLQFIIHPCKIVHIDIMYIMYYYGGKLNEKSYKNKYRA